MIFSAPLVGANEVVDELTFAPKRCARKLRLGNLFTLRARVRPNRGEADRIGFTSKTNADGG